MKKRLLIASGGYGDIPLIKAAKELGFFVITSGHDKKGLGIPYSDAYYQADNSDKEAVLSLARDLKVDALCPGAAGASAVSCSYAAEELGFEHIDSYQVAKILHNKDIFIRFAKENNIPSPEAESFNDVKAAIEAIDRFRFPLIIKPADLSGGRGISKATSKSQAQVAILNAFNASRIKKIIVEEFIEGVHYGVSSIIRDSRVVFYFCGNEYYYLNKYKVAGAFTPADILSEVTKTVVSEIEKMASILKLKDGIFHLQFILKDNKPYIIDVCRRVPGDLYVDFVKYATGVDYPSFIIKAFAGLDISDLIQRPPKGYYTRHVVMSHKNGIFKGITFDDIIKKNIIDKFMILKRGSKITDFMNQKLGIVFLKYDSREEMDTKNKIIYELIKAEVSD